MDANTISMANMTINNMGFVTVKLPALKRFAGIRGSRTLRVRITAATAGIAKMKAVLKFMRPCLYLVIAPTRLVLPTINKE
jgi:hypothetical protein